MNAIGVQTYLSNKTIFIWRKEPGSGTRTEVIRNYYYYHCQSVKLRKERFRAEAAKEAFMKQPSQIAIIAPIIDYYCQLIKTSLQKDTKSQEQELKEILYNMDKNNFYKIFFPLIAYRRLSNILIDWSTAPICLVPRRLTLVFPING